MSRRVLEVEDLAGTAGIARDVAGSLRVGTVVGLSGDLGAGKTTFVRALVEAMGGDGMQVSSPTFVLLHIYETPRGRVFHLDAYRTAGADDFEGIGFGELLTEGGVTVVEWPGRVESLLPADAVRIEIQALGPSARRFVIDWPGR